jgi:hypothetical protein
MMIKHHQGAVAMAKTEQEQGANPDAKALAGSIWHRPSSPAACATTCPPATWPPTAYTP